MYFAFHLIVTIACKICGKLEEFFHPLWVCFYIDLLYAKACNFQRIAELMRLLFTKLIQCAWPNRTQPMLLWLECDCRKLVCKSLACINYALQMSINIFGRAKWMTNNYLKCSRRVAFSLWVLKWIIDFSLK